MMPHTRLPSIYTYAAFRDTPRPDELCPRCNNPSLKLYFFERINIAGITILGERLACTDEKVWVSDLKEYPNEDA